MAHDASWVFGHVPREGGPGTSHTISKLAWKCLSVPPDELQEVAGEGRRGSVLGLCPI